MELALLHPNIQNFINSNLDTDLNALILKNPKLYPLDIKVIIEQIEAKKRCIKKLPTWFNQENIYYPNKLNIEQTSSEVTAQYKSKLIQGDSLIDITGGFGVDAFYFSKSFKNVYHLEQNTKLSKLVKHNFKQLKANNISTHNEDGITFLKNSNKTYHWIYIDPSRRHDSKGKVFLLNDCLPDVPKHLDLFFKHSKGIMIKTSPLLDLSIGLKEMLDVKAIHIVAVNNEVKELIWLLELGFSNKIRIKTINLKNDSNDVFEFLMEDEKLLEAQYSNPRSYLYEPNSAILKSGAFNTLSCSLNVFKIQKHSHLYTHDSLMDFPGRVFKINTVIPYNKKALKKLGIQKANITIRNFPETVQQLRKKFKITDGGSVYLFFTTDLENNKIVIATSKISKNTKAI